MKGKKLTYLAIALLLPGCIFVFLKIFGENEFAVEPLYSTVVPETPGGCYTVKAPYHIPDSVAQQLNFQKDTLVLVVMGNLSADGATQLNRVEEQSKADPLHMFLVGNSDRRLRIWKKCIFFLKEPFDLVLVDKKGSLRGQYNSNDREDVDRLLTEITIILKKY